MNHFKSLPTLLPWIVLKGKDCNLEYEYLERQKRGLQKLGLESDLTSKTVISNLISKKLTSKQDTQYRSWLLGTWVSNFQIQKS